MELEKEIQQARFDTQYQKLIVNILYTGGWMHGLQAQRLKPYGISPQQYNILRILRGQHPNPATINLLQQRMLDRMSNASRLVEKLRVKGLAERRICPEDRRAVDVLITQQGLAVLAELDQSAGEWEERFRILNEAEASQVNTLLDKLRG